MEQQSKTSAIDSLPTPGSSEKVWFITGASRGFGRIWAEAALKRGDKVAATARSLASLAELDEQYPEQVLTLAMDVTNPDQVKTAVEQAKAHFGRLDVVVNNAGYTLVGTIEESSQDDIRAQYETNVFGAISVIQAVLPILREQGSGHILGTSSGVGHVSYPAIGIYCSTKWALEAIYESLAAEVKAFGIDVTLIEPGAYATEFGSPMSAKFAPNLDVYDALKKQVFAGMGQLVMGDPTATPEAILTIVDAQNPPLRFNLGAYNLPMVQAAYAERLATWEAWQELSSSAQGN